MIERIFKNRMMKAAAIYFKDGESPLRDRIFVMADRFLIVENDEEDGALVLYNIDRIDMLEGVRPVETQQTQRPHVSFL